MKGLLIYLAIAIPALGGGLFYLGDGQELWNEMKEQEVVEEVVEEVAPHSTWDDLTNTQKVYVEAENCNSLTEVEALLEKYNMQGEYMENVGNRPDCIIIKDTDEDLRIYQSGHAEYLFTVLDPTPLTEGATKTYLVTPEYEDSTYFHTLYMDYIDYDFAYEYEGDSRLDQMIYINDITDLH